MPSFGADERAGEFKGPGKQQRYDKHLRNSRPEAFDRQKLSRVMSKQLEQVA